MKRVFGWFFLLIVSTAAVAQQGRDSISVFFSSGSSDLDAGARSTLDSFTAVVLGRSNAGLRLKGYCDSIGTDAYNDLLSNRRTASVQAYLTGKGIPARSIVLRKGYGERAPLNSNRTEEERRENRRVEIVAIYNTTAPPETGRHPADTLPAFNKAMISKAKEGQVLRLRNINFVGGRRQFLPTSMPALKELLEVMQANPTLEIEIQGHICCLFGRRDGYDLDSNEFNLSENRARAVYDYLVEGGISESRMRYKGFAGTRPLVNPEVTAEDQTANRRVEIMILKK